IASQASNLRGIVIASRDYGDKDKLVDFLSSNLGLISVCVKGALSINSKFSGFTIPFSTCDITVKKTGNFYYLSDYSILEGNSEIINSLEAMIVASHISSVIQRFVFQSENSREVYELAAYAYFTLARNTNKYLLIYSIFNWRFLAILGQTIEYKSCSVCDEDIIDDDSSIYLSILEGRSICEACFSKTTNKSSYVKVSFSIVKSLNFIAYGNLSKVFALSSNQSASEILAFFTTKYLERQLEIDIEVLVELNKLNLYSSAQDTN